MEEANNTSSASGSWLEGHPKMAHLVASQDLGAGQGLEAG